MVGVTGCLVRGTRCDLLEAVETFMTAEIRVAVRSNGAVQSNGSWSGNCTSLVHRPLITLSRRGLDYDRSAALRASPYARRSVGEEENVMAVSFPAARRPGARDRVYDGPVCLTRNGPCTRGAARTQPPLSGVVSQLF